MANEYLAHYGVLGMKWGVRRYQNADGSYTKRGLEHYRNTEKRYDEADSMYKQTKQLYKETKKNGHATAPNGKDIVVSKNVVKQAKEARKQAKKDMEFNYKQLKKDYKADQGKELYRSGKTITGNVAHLQMAGYIAIGTGMVERYLKNNREYNRARYVRYAGIGLEAINAIWGVKNEIEASKLRAYYVHKGEYK